jgi:hypothetical protein
MKEFAQKFKIKQIKAKDPVAATKLEQEFNAKLSKRYHGLPEANDSQYVILEAMNDNSSNDNSMIGSGGSIRVLPMHGFINFTQPAKFKTLSMQQAEQAISSKKLTRYMMHSKANGVLPGEGRIMTESMPSTKARSRLLQKLKSGGEGYVDDDVMDDLCFREPDRSSSKGTTSEILRDLGDDDIKIDADGTLGGANDSEFGGKRRFGRVGQIAKDEGGTKKLKSLSRDAVGIEAAAMQDDFYQRDVGAEYDELDYDPNEQFDDDDVDVGAEEVVLDEGGGFVADIDSDSNGEEDEEGDDFDMTGFESGFATSAGMKAMLARANGEEVQHPIVAPLMDEKRGFRSDANVTSGSDRSEDEMQSDSPHRESKSQSDTSVDMSKPLSGTRTTTAGVQLDENGLRVITKDAVRREIWLHNGSIKIRKLAKVYKISGKASKERQELFKKVCKELCTAKNGVFVLKQHYSKMD